MIKHFLKYTFLTCVLTFLMSPVSAFAGDYDFVVAADGSGNFQSVQEAINCRFSGFQDTLYPHGEKSHQYYRECIIEGTVDFIFGWSTSVFDRCTIVCKDHGFITAPSTNEGSPFGFVFLDCKITSSAPEESYYLGRPWRPFGKSAFLRCELGNMIKPEGWHNWNKPDAEKTTFFAEYKNKGSGASLSKRVIWSHQLTDVEATAFTPENILGDWITKFK